jgi:hypothetical protein
VGLWEKLEWLKLPPVDEQFTMSEPLPTYYHKDNLTYNYGLSALGLEPIVRTGMFYDQEFSETT